MPIENERKFLVKNTPENIATIKAISQKSYAIKQGYLMAIKDREYRIRSKGDAYFATFKCDTNIAGQRVELEQKISAEDFQMLWHKCDDKVIIKTRYIFNNWEIDVFHGRHEGLIIAENEHEITDDMLTFVSEEVTGDKKYSNAMLALE